MFNISLRVENLILKYDTANPYQLAKCLNFDIYELDLPSAIRGFLIRPLRRKCIVLNANLSELQKHIVLCHELGHARLHSGYGYYLSTNRPYYVPCRRENEANAFAIHILSYSHNLDAEQLNLLIKERRPDPKIIHEILNELIGQIAL